MAERALAKPTGSIGETEAAQAEQKANEALEQWYTLSSKNSDDRKLLRTTLLELLNYGRQGNKLLKVAEKLLEEDAESTQRESKRLADAEIRDRDQRRKAQLADAEERRIGKDRRETRSQKRKDERHREDIEDRRATRKREGERHAQEMRERETACRDDSREKNLYMALAAISVVATVFFAGCTMIFLFLTAKYSEPWGYAGSGVSFFLTLIIGLTGGTPQRIRMLFSLAKTGGGNAEVRVDS